MNNMFIMLLAKFAQHASHNCNIKWISQCRDKPKGTAYIHKYITSSLLFHFFRLHEVSGNCRQRLCSTCDSRLLTQINNASFRGICGISIIIICLIFKVNAVCLPMQMDVVTISEYLQKWLPLCLCIKDFKIEICLLWML